MMISAIVNILLAVVAVYFLNTLIVYYIVVGMFNKLIKVFDDRQIGSFGFLATISMVSLLIGFTAILLVAMEGLAHYKASHSLLASVGVSMTFGMGILLAALVFIATFRNKKR